MKKSKTGKSRSGWKLSTARRAATARRQAQGAARVAELAQRCTCGHSAGDHHARPGWPACSQCSNCQGFLAARSAFFRRGKSFPSTP